MRWDIVLNTQELHQYLCSIYEDDPMSFHKDFLNKHFYDLIDEIITNLTGKSFDINFV